MLLLDVLIRYSAVSFLLLLAFLAFRDGKGIRPARYALLLSISVAALLLGTAPAELTLPLVPFVFVRLLDMPNIVFVYWLGRSMFDEDFRVDVLQWGILLAYSAMILVYRLSDFGFELLIPQWYDRVVDVFTLGMLTHLALIALQGRADDLIEPRRRLRLVFVLALVGATVAAVLAENLFIRTHNSELSIFRAAIALVLVVWGLVWMIRFHPEILTFQKLFQPTPKPDGLDPKDADLHNRLKALMEHDKAYLDPELTIRTLADRLNTPEHRLRLLINQGLGYSNFSMFLNGYRINAIKTALQDPKKARLPVLTLALDGGYGSLAPFNRAFLRQVGMTPSAFRAQSLANPDQD